MAVTRRTVLRQISLGTTLGISGCLNLGRETLSPGIVKVQNQSSDSHRVIFQSPQKLSTAYSGNEIEVPPNEELHLRLLDEQGRYTITALVDGKTVGSIDIEVEESGDGPLNGPGIRLLITSDSDPTFEKVPT